MTDTAIGESRSDLQTLDFHHLPELSQLESDRFCRGCGYNLRQRAVRREPRTNLLLVQCPECGAFESVNDAGSRWGLLAAWLLRAMLAAWVGLLLLAAWLAGVFAFVIGYETARSRYRREWIQGQSQYHMRWDPWDRNEIEELLGMGLAAVLLGAVLGVLLVVLLPHWRRWAYPIPMVLILALAGAAAVADLMSSAVDDETWSAVVAWVVAAEATVLVAGVLGIVFGRPIARLAVRWLVPPGARGPLAYLWLVDGKTPPVRHRA